MIEVWIPVIHAISFHWRIILWVAWSFYFESGYCLFDLTFLEPKSATGSSCITSLAIQIWSSILVWYHWKSLLAAKAIFHRLESTLQFLQLVHLVFLVLNNGLEVFLINLVFVSGPDGPASMMWLNIIQFAYIFLNLDILYLIKGLIPPTNAFVFFIL